MIDWTGWQLLGGCENSIWDPADDGSRLAYRRCGAPAMQLFRTERNICPGCAMHTANTLAKVQERWAEGLGSEQAALDWLADMYQVVCNEDYSIRLAAWGGERMTDLVRRRAEVTKREQAIAAVEARWPLAAEAIHDAVRLAGQVV